MPKSLAEAYDVLLFDLDGVVYIGGTEIEGTVYRATISDAVRWTLDAKAVRGEMGDAWWNARCRQSLVTTVARRSSPLRNSRREGGHRACLRKRITIRVLSPKR